MDTSVKETTTVTRDPMVGATTTRTVRSGSSIFPEDFFVSKVNQVIFGLVSIVNVLILFRFILLLLGANQTGFVSFLVNFTNFFVAPFQGIFPATVVETGYFEVASILAIIAWYILALIFAVILGFFSTKTDESVTV
ncbi:MAG: hypothetical protein ACMG57_02015 [Candidatus Dojkabacteria bacterium]